MPERVPARRAAGHPRRLRRRPRGRRRHGRPYPGEVVGLVGGNGAGKTTLIKTLSGAQPADSGQIFIDGEPVTISSPRDAKALGIETIYQTLALADNIDAPGNVFLGREVTTRFGNLDDSAMEDATRKLMGRLNPKFKNFVVPVAVALGWSAPIRGDRPRRPLQRPDPDHGRADGSPRSGGDQAGHASWSSSCSRRGSASSSSATTSTTCTTWPTGSASCSRASSSGRSTRRT